MGGRLRVESQLGHGATFSFSIAAEVAEMPQVNAPPPAAREPAADLPALKIIVPDDNAVNRRVAVSLLKLLGYQADSAGDAKDLLERVKHTDYDVVFMDVQMPEMDGLEATRRIRADLPSGRQPHVVAMTAAAFPEDRARCLDAGMNDYIAKPASLDELAAVLRRAKQKSSGG
jgi:CheY-like chemotaxis protein